jgi:hypothetical protein
MKHTADNIHELSQKLGIYDDVRVAKFSGYAESLEHEDIGSQSHAE